MSRCWRGGSTRRRRASGPLVERGKTKTVALSVCAAFLFLNTINAAYDHEAGAQKYQLSIDREFEQNILG